MLLIPHPWRLKGQTYKHIFRPIRLLNSVPNSIHSDRVRLQIVAIRILIHHHILHLASVLNRWVRPQQPRHQLVESRLVEDDVRLVADLGLFVGLVLGPLDALLGVGGGPKGNLQHVVGLPEHLLCYPERVEDLDCAGLHAVCLSNLEGTIAALEDLVGDVEAGQPNGRAEAC